VAQVLLCTINPVNTDRSSQGYDEAAGVSRFKKVTNGRPFLRMISCFSYISRISRSVLFYAYCHYCILLHFFAVNPSNDRTAMSSSQPSDISWTSRMEHPCPGQVNISFHANPTAMDPDASCYLESCCLQSTQNAGQDLRSTQGCKASQSSIESAQLLQLEAKMEKLGRDIRILKRLVRPQKNPNIATSDTARPQYTLGASHSP